MLKFILSAALVTTLSSAAFAQSVGEQTGVNSALGIAPKTEDFIKEAATSDMLEITPPRSPSKRAMPTKSSSPSRWSPIIPKPPAS